jgi:hypothetical protein
MVVVCESEEKEESELYDKSTHTTFSLIHPPLPPFLLHALLPSIIRT